MLRLHSSETKLLDACLASVQPCSDLSNGCKHGNTAIVDLSSPHLIGVIIEPRHGVAKVARLFALILHKDSCLEGGGGSSVLPCFAARSAQAMHVGAMNLKDSGEHVQGMVEYPVANGGPVATSDAPLTASEKSLWPHTARLSVGINLHSDYK